MANTTGINETISCKKGFYFGDPCYALDEKLYDKWIEWGEKREKSEGRWCNDGKFVFEGKEIMVVDSTAYGDGCYGGYEMNYGVDAGCLAVIPLEFCDETKDSFADGGWINREFTGKVRFVTEDNGSFRLVDAKTGNILEEVETGYEEEEEEEDEETSSFWDEDNDN